MDIVDVVYVISTDVALGRGQTRRRSPQQETGVSAIGELETLVLLAILRLGQDAYGVSIRDEIENCTGRRLTRGAIYTALRRLENKKFVVGRLGESTPARGGRAKRYLSLTDAGMAELRMATRHLDRMRSGLEHLLADA